MSLPEKSKIVLITGITGQDGSYLAEMLLDKGYKVHGTMRRASYFNTSRIDSLYKNENFETHYTDLTDAQSMANLISEIKPDEIYNLGAMSHVKVSFEVPKYTLETNAIGPLNILEHIRQHAPHIKYYQASSSEMFGATHDKPPYNENTKFWPQSPYGVAKLAAFHTTKNYRDGYNLFAVNGILFNHESPRRGETFVTRKITRGVAAIVNNVQKELRLGNLDAVRDWGHSKDYVRAIYLMMQQDKPDDYVVATGDAMTIREAVEHCFNEVGLNWKDYVVIDPRYFRPNEVPYLQGDSSKIRALGWKPEYDARSLLKEMLQEDLKEYENN